MKPSQLIAILNDIDEDKDVFIIDDRKYATEIVAYYSSKEGAFIHICPDLVVDRTYVKVTIK